MRSQSVPGYLPRITGTLTQDSQQPAGGWVAQRNCCHCGICLGSHEMLHTHTGKTEKLLMFIKLPFCNQSLTESCSWVTLAVIQGCAGTWMPRSAKHLLPLLPPLQMGAPRGRAQPCVTHTRPLPSPVASHLPQNELLGVCVNST